jgi:acyl-CoA thioester hydrolase
MDAYKHVNNTAYLRYAEEARIRMFDAGPGADSVWDAGRIVIAGMDIDYRRPLAFRSDPVAVHSAVIRVGRSSFDIAAQVLDGDRVHAATVATIVAVESGTGRSRPLEDAERAWLAEHAGELPHRGPARRPAGWSGPDPGPARHTVEIGMRWADMDVNAHVNNVAYATYMQEARAHLFALHDAGGRAPLVRGLVVVRMHLDWLRPLVYRPEPVTAHTWFSSVTAATVTVECEIRADDLLYARGTTTLALFDFEADRPRRITPAERDALTPYLAPPPTT